MKRFVVSVHTAIMCGFALMILPAPSHALDPLNPKDTQAIQQGLRTNAQKYLSSKPNPLESIAANLGGVSIALDPTKLDFKLDEAKKEVSFTWPYVADRPLNSVQQTKLRMLMRNLIEAIAGQIRDQENKVIFSQAEWESILAQEKTAGKQDPFAFTPITLAPPEMVKVFRDYAASYLAREPKIADQLSQAVGTKITLETAKSVVKRFNKNDAVIYQIVWPYTSNQELNSSQRQLLYQNMKALVEKITGNHPTQKNQFFNQDEWNQVLAQELASAKPNSQVSNPFVFNRLTIEESNQDFYPQQSVRLLENEGWILPGFGYIPPWPHTLPRTKSSERFMGYLGVNGMYSPYLDALDQRQIQRINQYRNESFTGYNLPYNNGEINQSSSRETDENSVVTTEQLKGRDVQHLNAEGASLLKHDRPKKALSMMQETSKLFPNNTTTWYLRAVAEWELGQKQAATTSARYAHALELTGEGDSASTAKTLESVQGPSRRFLLAASESLTLQEAKEIVNAASSANNTSTSTVKLK